jgi:hypothetical protein
LNIKGFWKREEGDGAGRSQRAIWSSEEGEEITAFQARQMREAARMRNRGEGIWERIRFVSSGEERTF